jgi:cytochrome c oxidase cbb3-type subunit III
MTNKKDDKNKKPKIETTGHEWDGISEYNIPAPRWWLIVWIICIVWSVIYWFFYPTWPTPSGHSKGSLNWSGVSQLKESQREIEEIKSVYLDKFSKSDFKQISQDPELMEFALNGGKTTFKDNCAACHGTGAQGAKGYPNLNDDDWLWGGKIEDIYTTIKYGIRSGHDKARSNQMPSFGLDQILNKEEISEVVKYVMSLTDKKSHSKKGETIFKENCVACHSAGGKGNRELGAPNLSDAIWLYGGAKEEITHSVTYAHAGVMPYWTGRLDEQTIKQLAIYVHSLGGGE